MLYFYFRVFYIGMPAMTQYCTCHYLLVLCNCENTASQLAMHIHVNAMAHVNYLLDGKSFLSVSDVLLSISSAVMKVDKQFLLSKKMHIKPL